MNYIFKRVSFFLFFIIGTTNLSGKTLTDEQVFGTWITGKNGYCQDVFSDVNLNSLNQRDDKLVKKVMIVRHNRLKNKLEHLGSYFDRCFDDNLFKENIDSFFSHTKKLNSLIDKDVNGFLQHLRVLGICSKVINNFERRHKNMDQTVDKYLALMRLLCADGSLFKERQNLFSLANNFFEFSFYPDSFSSFKKMLLMHRYHPQVRLLYATMWNHLVGDGWKNWHRSCIEKLKAEADLGKTIVYAAGGCDIYQLIKNGIYNICVVDPMIPTQVPYYSDHWNWFAKKGFVRSVDRSGDRLVFSFKDKSVYMERTGYKEQGKFKFTGYNNKKYTFPESVTTWSVFVNDKLAGNVVFERRYCNKNDFVHSDNKRILMSFNELCCVTNVEEGDHWGIFPDQFDENLLIYVKQLRRPLTKNVLCNMTKADKISFDFLRLGVSPTLTDAD